MCGEKKEASEWGGRTFQSLFRAEVKSFEFRESVEDVKHVARFLIIASSLPWKIYGNTDVYVSRFAQI